MRFFYSLLLLVLVVSCQPKPIGEIHITNPSQDTLKDAQVILLRDSLVIKTGEIANDKVVIVMNATGAKVPSQLDDVNGDGQWDEMVLVYTLAPSETAVLSLQIVDKSKAPIYKARTQANFGKKIGSDPVKYLTREVLPKAPLPRGAGYPYKTDGPTWESDMAGYRHYFDGRNCRDFFCKLIPDMVLDTVGIWPDGTIGDTYHTLKSWGRDVLGVGQSFGLGGIAAFSNDSLVRLGILRVDTVDNCDSTTFALIANGPVRSIIRLNHYGWDLGGAKIDVQQDVSIWAGRYVYENSVKFFGDTASKYLVTGLVHNNDSNGLKILDFAPGIKALYTHDKQTYNRQFYMGLALFVPSSQFIESFNTPAEGPGILYTYCAKLKAPFDAPLKYYAMAACELQNPKFMQAGEFIKLLNTEAAIINNPVVLKY